MRFGSAHLPSVFSSGNSVRSAVAHDEGLGPNWKARRAFWADRAANESVSQMLAMIITQQNFCLSVSSVQCSNARRGFYGLEDGSLSDVRNHQHPEDYGKY